MWARVEDSLSYYAALKKAGVPVEMHLYAQDGHAFGLRRTKFPATAWPQLVEKWLDRSGWCGSRCSGAHTIKRLPADSDLATSVLSRLVSTRFERITGHPEVGRRDADFPVLIRARQFSR